MFDIVMFEINVLETLLNGPAVARLFVDKLVFHSAARVSGVCVISRTASQKGDDKAKTLLNSSGFS